MDDALLRRLEHVAQDCADDVPYAVGTSDLPYFCRAGLSTKSAGLGDQSSGFSHLKTMDSCDT